MRRLSLFAAIGALAVALAACGGGAHNPPVLTSATRVPETATAVPASTATQATSTESTPQVSVSTPIPAATPVANASATGAPVIAPTGGNTLGPPVVMASAGGDQEKGQFGPYFWVRSDGLVAKNEPGSLGLAFGLPDHALAVPAHDSVSFAVQNGPTPDQLELLVYRKDGNEKSLPVQGGQVPAFKPSTDPLAKTTLTAGSPATWSPDLQPGSYFIQLNVQWPAVQKYESTPLTASYAFLIEVR